MNIRRGFFRLWVIASLTFVALVAAFAFEGMKKSFDDYYLSKHMDETSILLLPVNCGDVRGKETADYTAPAWHDRAKKTLCWYQEPKFRALYPEYKDMSNPDLSTRLYKAAGIDTTPRQNPWLGLVFLVAWGLAIPLIVLLIGAGIGWALSGFAAPRQ